MRKAHYWKPATAVGTPSLICVLDTETKADPTVSDVRGELHRLVVGVATCYRLERGRRTRQHWLTFHLPQQFWAWLDTILDGERKLWVVGHNLPFDLGILGAWGRFMTEDWLWGRLILEHGVFLMEGTHQGKDVMFADTFNWYKCGLKAIGKAVNLPKLNMPSRDLPTAELTAYCKRDVEITAAGMDALINYVRETGAGPWGPTIASLAFNTYRKLFMNHKVLVSDCREALDLERSAYYGGIVATNYLGEVPASPVYELDVVSMYPAACCHPLPATYLGVCDNPAPALFQRRLASYHCFADVTLSSPATPYPLRDGDKVIYPVGTFRTCLPHPELCQAVKLGLVRTVHKLTWHDARPVFKEYMEHFTKMKATRTGEQGEAFRTIDKYLANALYGKTGQLTPRYAPLNAESLREFARLHGLDEESLTFLAGKVDSLPEWEHPYSVSEYNVVLPLRDYFGYVEIELGRFESRDSVPAIAATVTSLARLKLRTFQALAGPRHWFYSDTDSIWVDTVGYRKLWNVGAVKPGQLGFLSPGRRVRRMVVHGRKDYELEGVAKWDGKAFAPETDRVRKLKGVKGSAAPYGSDEFAALIANTPRYKDLEFPPGTEAFAQLHFPGVIPQVKAQVDCGVLIELAVKQLRHVVDWCVAGPDGWTSPIVKG